MAVNFNPSIQQVRRRMLGHAFINGVSTAIDNAADEGKREVTIPNVEAKMAALLGDYLLYEGWSVFFLVANDDDSRNILVQW